MTAQTPVLPVAQEPERPHGRQIETEKEKGGEESRRGWHKCVGGCGEGSCFGPPLAQMAMGGSCAAGVRVCVISQPANENI